MPKDDILYLLVLPINIGYYYFYKYLYQKNKANNELIHGDDEIRFIRQNPIIIREIP
jgi:hypothetical protein